MVKISTQIDVLSARLGEEKAVEYVARAGFDAWDFSMFRMIRTIDWATRRFEVTDHPLCGSGYLAYARKLRMVGEDMGIVCNQSHAPFPTDVPNIRDLMKRCLEATAEAGGKICIIHPGNRLSMEENAEMYMKLLPFAKGCGVKIATENMWCWNQESDQAEYAACSHHDEFLAYMEAVNDPYFVACVDVGHAEMRGLGTSAPTMIRTLGKHVQAVHLHDNDLWHDSHAMPFTMQIDFPSVLQALRDVGYTGDLTLEADNHLLTFPDDRLLDGERELENAARRLADLYANL